MKIILASASPRRAEILRQAGVTFSVLSSAIDETPYQRETPEALVLRLSAAKAELVAARSVGPAFVVAADTVVVTDGHILGKPRSTDDARHILQSLSGRTHTVLTGVTMIRLPDAQRRQFVESTLVTFSVLTPEEISAYLDSGEPFDKAGAYAIQGIAARFIPRIEGCYYNVMGLPLAHLLTHLRDFGWSEEKGNE
jgi:septum formation protein